MKILSWRGLAALLTVLFVGLVIASGIVPSRWTQASTWQQLSRPGPLSGAHAFLKENCAACHTPGKGVVAVNCIACHANNTALLQRQPTAFHADITTCTPCHLEHLGGVTPTKMDHAALARYGLSQNPKMTALEATLNCAVCHATKDRHRGLFGNACASCHSVAKWTIPEYRHPSPNSQQCVQCHQAPPSHYMMHFTMVSASVARQPNAKVSQCFKCHQTTTWNDIRGVGWYKHH